MAQSDLSQEQRDEALLQKPDYKQELKHSLDFLSSFDDTCLGIVEVSGLWYNRAYSIGWKP